ncbi:OmpA family protein [Jiulongibacter sp. NS-SX5]|uniref:OmpA family protein n=1 Tax=Jiulongibacter sp. NS-SX5 TaxID=3463854 RepID=UPI004059B285
MKNLRVYSIIFLSAGFFTSCVSKKKFVDLQSKYEVSDRSLVKCSDDLLTARQEISSLEGKLAKSDVELQNVQKYRQEQIADLRDQVADLQRSRDKQMVQVEDLTVLSKEANRNIEKTLDRMTEKDDYIRHLLAAKSKVDSMNLALAFNLKKSIGLDMDDKDVDIKVDKTVVMINISDSLLFQTGSYNLTSRANEVLGKIAKVIQSRPELEVMVEGYTDNRSINTAVLKDNWDLSVKRATSVVRLLQNNYSIDPNRLIAAGRGEFNKLVPNNSPENMAKNRRTRIILMPKLDQFYDLLDPNETQPSK